MGNVAMLMKRQGHSVSGSDREVYPPMSDLLQDAGIEVFEGFSAERLQAVQADYVIVGNAATRGNPEVEFLLCERAFPYLSLPELIRKELLAGRPSLVISGTHGKTTTASMAAILLHENNTHPGWLIGGVPGSLNSGAVIGDATAPFVIEGDEYDSAFFDKRSKFIHYAPTILTINHIEFDHSDIFRDLPDVQRSFSHLIKLVPEKGTIIVNGDDPNIDELLPVPWGKVLRVGFGGQNDIRIGPFVEDARSTRFSLSWNGLPWDSVEWPLMGEYNVRNGAIAATAAALLVYPDAPTALSLAPLERFKGVKRRQDIRFQSENLILMEDFGHHPTAIESVLTSLKNRYPGHHLTAAFEPRSNTSATNVMEDAWRRAFLPADALFLAPIFRGDTIPDKTRLNRDYVLGGFWDEDKAAHAFDDFPSMETQLRAHVSGGGPHLVVFFSNGAFGGILDAWVTELNDKR